MSGGRTADGREAADGRETAGLPRIFGHGDLLERIDTSIHAGRLPQSLLLHGPTGVGKRSVALWTAARLHCGAEEAPCRACRSCHLASRLEHPDIHLHFPMPRPGRASSRRKMREALEVQREERLAMLREDPHASWDEDAVTGIYLTAVENIREQASRRPAMGRIAVFIISEADRMVPQSASPEAANAFLKLLEEPPDFAYLILTTANPSALLPTIRSRTARLRLPPLADDEIAAFLRERRGLEPKRAAKLATRADGSIGRAITLSGEEEDPALEAADALLASALAGRADARFRAASDFTARGARSVLAPALSVLEERLRDLLCRAAGAAPRMRDPEAIDRLAKGPVPSAAALLAALAAVDEAREGARRNLNPQSTVTTLLADMTRAFEESARP